MTIKEDVGKQNLKYPIDILNEDILKLVKKHKIITKRTMKEKEWGSTINFYLPFRYILQNDTYLPERLAP